MAGKKPYQMAPAPPAKKPSFTNTLGDAFQDVGDYAKRGLADVQDAYDSVKNKLKTGDYGQPIDPASRKVWPEAPGRAAQDADRHHKYHLEDRHTRDTPLPPVVMPGWNLPKASSKASAPKPASPPKPAVKDNSIDPWTADQEYGGARMPFSKDKGIKANPPPGRPGSKKLAPSQAVRDGDIVTGRAPFTDRGVGRRVPSMGAKTDTVNATVGGKKKAIKVPRAGKVSL